jgi:hypothetical protein
MPAVIAPVQREGASIEGRNCEAAVIAVLPALGAWRARSFAWRRSRH